MGVACFKAASDVQKVPQVPRPAPPAVPNGSRIVRALFDYSGINDDDLPFKKGDRLEVEESGSDGDWWMAVHVRSKKKGYIPSNYVCEDDNTPQSQDWWYEYDRKESNKMLLLAGNPTGTFLVREATDKKSYVLSVRDEEVTTGEPCIKHYRIRKLDNGGVYISHRRVFDNMIELIENYKENHDGLCCRLTGPCPKFRPIVPFRDLEVNRDVIKFEKEIGAGYFGKVYKAKLRNVVDVAVKTLKTGQMTAVSFLKEAQVMHRLSHRRLVGLIHVCSETEPVWIVTEFMENGSLLKYLRSEQGKMIKFPTLVEMAAQVADGMSYLEKHNLIHRDLRADNVLVDEHNNVKVADFGLARILDDEDIYEAAENTKFPIKWTAPEAANKRQFSIKSDVWSFGVLLYEIITYARSPYTGMTGSETLRFIDKGKRLEKPRDCYCSDEYYEIMLKCWKHKPAERPTFEFLFITFDDYFVATEPEYTDSFDQNM